MSLQATIQGIPYPIVEGSFSIKSRINERDQYDFVLVDTSAVANFLKGQKVIVSDSTLGTLFTGFINTATLESIIAHPQAFWFVNCVDWHYVTDKRTINTTYTNQQAGYIVLDMYQQVLQYEGIIAQYALSHVTTQNDWSAGTLSNLISTGNVGDGDVELLGSSSVAATYNTQVQWNTGTKTNVVANSGGDLSLSEQTRNWDNSVKSGQSLWGNGNPSDQVSSGQYWLHCDASSETRSRLDFAGTWANFTVTCDCYLHANTYKSGFTYRTTGWSNNDSTYAYAIEFDNAGISLRVGSNGGASSSTQIANTAFSPQLATGQFYTIKAVISGSSHSIYVNGTLYISVTDSTFTAAGYIGLRNRNSYTSGTWRYFDNFGIASVLSGTWTSPSTSIGSITTIASTSITWDTSLSTGGTVTVQTSINGGSTYTTCTNGGAIPGLAKGSSGAGINVLVKVTLSTGTPLSNADIKNLQWSVIGGYVASGTRSTAPLGNDVGSRANQSGWGTAFDTQVWAKIGTGTDSVASNELVLTNTTGDCYEQLGSTSYTDEDETHRFSLSASTISAGIALRFLDSGNWYRLYASTTALTLVKAVVG